MRSIIRFAFSTVPRPKGTQIMKKFTQEYYFENYDKCLVQEGFPQAVVELNNKKVKIIGVPITVPENDQTYQKTFEELTTIIATQEDVRQASLIQIDPTPYLFFRRYAGARYMKEKLQNNSGDELLKHTPMIPLEVEELRLDLRILDLVEAFSSEDGGNKKIEAIFSGKETGYFSNFLLEFEQKQGQVKMEEFQEKFSFAQQQTLLYEYEPYQRGSSPCLHLALFMSLVQNQPTYLGGLSKIFLRVYAGYVLGIEEMRQAFKDLSAILLEKPEANIAIPLEVVQVKWRQYLMDYYLIYTINKICAEESEMELLTVYVENLHLDPLRQALLEQGGQLIEEVDMPYPDQFKFPQPIKDETDEMLIEKHAIFDVIEEQAVWNERFIKNPFPYISKSYPDLTPEEQKEVLKTFYKYTQMYLRIWEKVRDPKKKQQAQ